MLPFIMVVNVKICISIFLMKIHNDLFPNYHQEEEARTNETWLRNLAIVLLTSGHKRLLIALSNCIGDWIPNLARSCLVTIAWISCSISSSKGAHRLMSFACSILAPRLLESLNYDRALEERVLASLSLLHFAKQTGVFLDLQRLSDILVCHLDDLFSKLFY